MNVLLVAGTAVAGLFVGGALDPVGQRLADRSRADDERRRAERLADEERRLAEADPTPVPVPEATSGPGAGTEVGAAPSGPPVRNLLASGRSPGRTLGAALVTGVLFGGAAHRFGSHLILAPTCVFFAMLVAVSVTDLSHRLVPRRLLYAGVTLIVPLLVVTSAVDHRWHSLVGSVVAGAVAFGLFFAIWWFVPRGMGFGDVRLAGVIGVTVGYLSLLHAYVAFLAGFVIGMVFGLTVMVGSPAGRKTRIPFAPSLAAGAVFAVFWGGAVARHLFHVDS